MPKSATGRTRRPTASSATSRRSARSIRRARRCSRRTVDRDGSRLPAGDRRRDGRTRADRGAMARDLVAARAVRARRRRGVGQDVGDGRARRVPGARRDRSVRRRRPRCVARQRALPDVHEQGDREPAAADPPRARRARPGRGRRARDHELPRVRREAARPLRHARGHRAGPAGALPRPAHRALRARHGPDDVRAREDRDPGRRDRQHPAAGRPGLEPPAHARRDHRVQRGTAGAVAGAPLRPRVPRRAGADRAGHEARRSSGS